MSRSGFHAWLNRSPNRRAQYDEVQVAGSGQNDPVERLELKNGAIETFFSSFKTERTARKVSRIRDDADADVFDYIESFYNPRRRH
jgi:hypothetical protein